MILFVWSRGLGCLEDGVNVFCVYALCRWVYMGVSCMWRWTWVLICVYTCMKGRSGRLEIPLR